MLQSLGFGVLHWDSEFCRCPARGFAGRGCEVSTITQRETETQRRRPYRLSVAKYEAMVASGAFTKADRFELIEGILVEKMTKG